MIKIQFPAEDREAATHLGAALTAYGAHGSAAEPASKEDNHQQHLDAFQADLLDKIAGAFDLDMGALIAVVNADGRATEMTATTENKIKGSIDAAGADTTNSNDARLDEHGVPFNGEMCGTAAIPFYASGAHAGQWKKLRGVDQADYDKWYAEAKAAVAPTELEAVDTSDAFKPDTGGTTADPAAPHDAGTLMAWVSGMQGAGRLTQDQVNSAYTQAELTMPDIFPSDVNTPDLIKARVESLYMILSAWA